MSKRATDNPASFAAMPGFYRIRANLIRRYIFSTDHKVVGIQYGLASLVFLLLGFLLAALFRWQLAFPGQPVPLVGRWLGELNAPGGIILRSEEHTSELQSH